MDNKYDVNHRLFGNPIRQLAKTEKFNGVLPNLSRADQNLTKSLPKAKQLVIDSWKNQFFFKEEAISDKGEMEAGLRPPQLGAIHATIAHWKVKSEPATIVLPTGVGKTETMVSLLVSQKIPTLLVIVPTDALREQITGKFIGLGLLREIGVVGKNARYPLVGTFEHSTASTDDVKKFFNSCNVVVSTMAAINNYPEKVKTMIVDNCSTLFVDEAHHTPAQTWKNLKTLFKEKPILQFTATPFRNDGKAIDGKIVFEFPVRLAQEMGYFKQVKYNPVFEYDPLKFDEAISIEAVKQLRSDLKKGYDHILMARVESVARANQVFELYKKETDLNPVQIHSGVKSKKEKDEIRAQITSKRSRIIVCVDMLGEGFDLPELKVAALHDVKKSLAITIQLIGRFTRAKKGLGDPTFIVNAGNIEVGEELNDFYSQDSDWNSLLSQKSERVTRDQINLWEFIEGFKRFPNELPLQNIRPAMSTVIYRTGDSWKPEDWKEGFKSRKFEKEIVDINKNENTLVLVTATKAKVEWAQVKDIYDWFWDVYILFWDKKQKLLFINSSSNQGQYSALAKAVCGEDVGLVSEGEIFRCFSGVKRLKLQNVGLITELGRLIRYTMSAGSDVESGLTPQQKSKVKRANIFGNGYEDGHRTSIGCSYKGRIWSKRRTNVEQLTKWCSSVGKKVTDSSIDPDEILKGTLVPKFLTHRPEKMPIGIDWTEDLYTEPETNYSLLFNNNEVPLSECELKLSDPSLKGVLKFEIIAGAMRRELRLEIGEKNGEGTFKFVLTGKQDLKIKHNRGEQPLDEYFNENVPKIWFHDGSSLEGNSYIELKGNLPLYNSANIKTWDWSGTDIKKESQGLSRDKNSIQYKVIENLIKEKPDLIFDDDGPGEIGDIISISDLDDEILIDIYHCKFSSNATPGGRVEDLYEVCGQAQKSVNWAQKPHDIIRHLNHREGLRISQKATSRFVVGSHELALKLLTKMNYFPVKINMHIVQPGLSKSKASNSQLQLLSVTENYLSETYSVPLAIIASD